MTNKILAIAAIASALSMNVSAQNYFPSSGSVGINTGSAPIYPFQINSDVNFSYQPSVSPTWARRQVFGNSDGGLSLYGKSWNSGSGITLRAQNSYYGNGSIEFTAFNTNTSSTDDAFVFDKMTSTGGAQSTLMTINYQGNIIPYGNISYLPITANLARRSIFANSGGGLSLYSNSGDQQGSSITLKSRLSGYNNPGSILLTACKDITTPLTNAAFDFNYYDTYYSSYNTVMSIGLDATIIPYGDIKFQQQTISSYRRQIFANSAGGLSLYSKTSDTNGSSITLKSLNSGYSNPGGILFTSRATAGNAFEYNVNDGTNYNTLMTVTYDGKMVIGNVPSNTTNPYKLYVETGILTEKVKVALHNTTDWSDYVFAEDYNLQSLKEVENYIGENKHLPGIPSADEVVKEGIDLATMDAKLLQKIEELTLYVIKQQKEIEQLKNTSNKQ